VEDKGGRMKDSKDNRGYKKLKIYRLAHDLAIRIHTMTLKLPKFEMFEEGSQIRRSSKSVSSNIIEGYVLRKYKQEYIHYLIRALASSAETIEHLEFLWDTRSLKDKTLYESIYDDYNELNSMLYSFIESVGSKHDTVLVGKIDK